MRRPKQPGGAPVPSETKRPGGSAWQRVQQFNLARGLPTAPTPGKSAPPPAKPARAGVKKKSTKRLRSRGK